MTGRPLRIVAPDDQPTPRVDNDTTMILNEAVDPPAAPRTTYCLGDSAVHLHTLPSLTAQPQLLLPSAIHHARERNHSWTPDRPTAQPLTGCRSPPTPEPPMINLTRITHIMPLWAHSCRSWRRAL